MSLDVLAHNLKRGIAMLGPQSLIDAIRVWMILRSVIRKHKQDPAPTLRRRRSAPCRLLSFVEGLVLGRQFDFQ